LTDENVEAVLSLVSLHQGKDVLEVDMIVSKDDEEGNEKQ